MAQFGARTVSILKRHFKTKSGSTKLSNEWGKYVTIMSENISTILETMAGWEERWKVIVRVQNLMNLKNKEANEDEEDDANFAKLNTVEMEVGEVWKFNNLPAKLIGKVIQEIEGSIANLRILS